MRTRAATQQQQKAELQEHLRECRAEWRKEKRKEQGKKMRGCRGGEQHRKLLANCPDPAGREPAAAVATAVEVDWEEVLRGCAMVHGNPLYLEAR